MPRGVEEEQDLYQMHFVGACYRNYLIYKNFLLSVCFEIQTCVRLSDYVEALRSAIRKFLRQKSIAPTRSVAKTTVVMGIQGQIAGTSGALQEVAGALVRELSKSSTSGALVSTTA